jgi:hypothetical protein
LELFLEHRDLARERSTPANRASPVVVGERERERDCACDQDQDLVHRENLGAIA